MQLTIDHASRIANSTVPCCIDCEKFGQSCEQSNSPSSKSCVAGPNGRSMNRWKKLRQWEK